MTDVPNTDVLNLEELQSGTILGLVNDILKKGDFSNMNEIPTKEGDVDLGPVTLYEKAIASAILSVQNQCVPLAAEVKTKPLNEKQLRQQLGLKVKTGEVLTDLLTTGIRQRFGNSWKFDGIKIGAGWRVIGYNLGEDEKKAYRTKVILDFFGFNR